MLSTSVLQAVPRSFPSRTSLTRLLNPYTRKAASVTLLLNPDARCTKSVARLLNPKVRCMTSATRLLISDAHPAMSVTRLLNSDTRCAASISRIPNPDARSLSFDPYWIPLLVRSTGHPPPPPPPPSSGFHFLVIPIDPLTGPFLLVLSYWSHHLLPLSSSFSWFLPGVPITALPLVLPHVYCGCRRQVFWIWTLITRHKWHVFWMRTLGNVRSCHYVMQE